jgi:hypothetical protein
MLTAADSSTHSFPVADDLIDEAPPVAGGSNEVSMAAMVRRDEVIIAKVSTQHRTREFLTDACMNGAVELAFTECSVKRLLYSFDTESHFNARPIHCMRKKSMQTFDALFRRSSALFYGR